MLAGEVNASEMIVNIKNLIFNPLSISPLTGRIIAHKKMQHIVASAMGEMRFGSFDSQFAPQGPARAGPWLVMRGRWLQNL